ncbi:MAG TPA: pyridoxal phosphate-dependent aminotransferase [bacterium]|nr:pyridoxal phosphate-dependent aminotransferase [bacterium]
MQDLNIIEKTYRDLAAQGRPILKLFSGNPNDEGFLYPGGILEEAYARYFRDQDYRPHSKGLIEARRAIAAYYAERGAEVDPENLLLTAGTSESFLYLFRLLARPGDNVLAPNPAYPLFDHIAGLAGIELRHYVLREEGRWSMDFHDLDEKADDRTRAVVLISPNNPTGHVASQDEILALVGWANQKKIPLICDEVFSEFFYGAGKFPRPMAVARPDLCFTLNGISKMFALPALKLGWIAVTGKKSLVDPAVDRLETTADTFLSCHIPIQKALPDLFEKGRAFVDGYVAEVGRRRLMMMNLLRGAEEIRFVEPRGGFYLTAAIETGLPEEDFVVRLMKKEGVFVHPGYFFDYEKGCHVVLSFLVHPERMRPGIERLLSFLQGR